MTNISYWDDDWKNQIKTVSNEQITKNSNNKERVTKDSNNKEESSMIETLKNTHIKSVPKTTRPPSNHKGLQSREERVQELEDRFNNGNIRFGRWEQIKLNSKSKEQQFGKKKYSKESLPTKKKTRFCMHGSDCAYINKCRWAHSVEELEPQLCHRSQNCRLIVNCNNEVHNNKNTRICMYRHAESVQAYIIRTNQGVQSITVDSDKTAQAKEMIKFSGGNVAVYVK
jgi:hypothetical protein